jgi:hypothetical protein
MLKSLSSLFVAGVTGMVGAVAAAIALAAVMVGGVALTSSTAVAAGAPRTNAPLVCILPPSRCVQRRPTR